MPAMIKPAMPTTDMFAAMLDDAPVGALVYAADGTITWANATLAAMLDSPFEDWCAQPREALAHPWLRGLFDRAEFIHVPATEAREARWFHGRYHVLEGGGWIGHILDFTEIKALVEERDSYKQKFEAVNTIDTVTSLLNHRGVFQALEPQVSRSRRYGNALAVVILRLGMAEAFEHRFDPGVRTAILIAFTQLLNDQTRWADFTGRLEGAEFMLVLPETGEGDAHALVSKIRERMCGLSLPAEVGIDTLPALCVGVAEWKKGDDSGMLIRRARENLECQA